MGKSSGADIYSCAGCIHLQKECMESNGCKLYKCSSQERSGSIVGWITADRELKTMGGSCCNILHPGDVIRYGKVLKQGQSWLYCGTVEGNRKLLYNRKNKEYKVKSKDCFRTQEGHIRKGISIIWHDKNRKEWCRKQAEKYKKEWLKEHGKSSNRD